MTNNEIAAKIIIGRKGPKVYERLKMLILNYCVNALYEAFYSLIQTSMSPISFKLKRHTTYPLLQEFQVI